MTCCSPVLSIMYVYMYVCGRVFYKRNLRSEVLASSLQRSISLLHNLLVTLAHQRKRNKEANIGKGGCYGKKKRKIKEEDFRGISPRLV